MGKDHSLKLTCFMGTGKTKPSPCFSDSNWLICNKDNTNLCTALIKLKIRKEKKYGL